MNKENAKGSLLFLVADILGESSVVGIICFHAFQFRHTTDIY